jgi:hypothetical protein
MNHVSFRHAIFLAFVALLAASLAFGQSDLANVSGVVTDPSGSAVPNAKVQLKSQATGQTREANTNESGVYSIPSVPPGMYTLTVEGSGFKKYESKDNKVDPSLPANISAQLTVGQLTETVEVTATASQLQTESGALGKIVEGKQIQDLQLNGRNPIFLALLKPGVRGGSLAGFSFDLTTGGLNINGSRTQDNLITYDGAVAVRTRSNGTSIGTADLDQTAEVQVLTASYGAEFGRSSGGQIRVVTKSGTRDFHGSAYEYFRNDALDANSWGRNRVASTNFVAPFKFNQFGYNLSGPVIFPGFNKDRSKVFFTFAEEWARRRTVATNTRVVPSPLMKQGNFSELLTPSIWFSSAQIIKDPTTGQPFAGNIIPVARQSKNGMALLSVYPDPNLFPPIGANNWIGVASAPTNQRKDTIGLDILPTSKDNIRFRGQLFHYYDLNPFQTNFLFSGRTFDRPNQTGSLNWTHTFSPTFLMEALVAASRDQVFIRMQDTPAFDRAKYGITYPYIYPAKDRPSKLPAVNIPGFQEYTGSPYPSNSVGPIYNANLNFTKIHENHTIKFGMSFERSGENDYDQINVQGVPGGTDNQNGRFEFSNTRPGGSGVAIGDAALGLFNNYAEIGQRSFTPYRGHMVEWFAQDEWKATQKLKIIYGVRHTIVQPYYSLWNNTTVFDPKYYDKSKEMKVDPVTGNPIAGTGDPYNGIVIPGNGWPDAAKGRVGAASDPALQYLFRGGNESRWYSDIDKFNFQPRLGIAYQLNPKTVVRAGGGKFTTRLGVSDSIFLGGNPPLQPLASVPVGVVDNPGGGSLASFPLSVNTQARTFHMPQAYTWNFVIEREVMRNTVFSASYIGRRSLFGQREKNINQPTIGTVQANPGVNINALRPYKGYGPIRETYDDANGMYNSLQLEFNRRFSNGLSYGVAYTLSKCMDSGSNQRDVIPDAYDATFLWGPCDYDTRHVAVINFIYQLPFFRTTNNKALRAVAGGWQITGVTQFQSGTPVKIQTSDDFAGIGPGSGNQISYFWKYANFGQDPNYPKQFAAGGNAADPAQWLTVTDSSGKALFTAPANGTMVKDRLRNYFYNPGFQNWNLGMFKEFAMTERHKVLFRAEAFNWLNHPNWSGMDTNPRSATFGKVTGKQDQRNLQLSLRYSF